MRKTYEMDMINGPLLKNILQYAFPLMLSGILQLMFNAADVIVVGRFAGSQALAAVGSTGALCNLLINLFVGISIGTNVLVARYYGARDLDGIQETINTSIITVTKVDDSKFLIIDTSFNRERISPVFLVIKKSNGNFKI